VNNIECPNCGGYNVQIYPELEYEDIWCTCLDCGYEWLEFFPEDYDDREEGEEKGESQWDV